MWFLFTVITFLAWGAADLFYKRSADAEDRYSHLKTSIVVGAVMGAAAFITIFVRKIDYDPVNILVYLPVSAMYILSMTVGYFGLRYLELSVSSPVQNASGAVAAILLMIFLHEIPDTVSLIAIAVITAGVVLLGVFEREKDLKAERKYKIGFGAFLMPILYCVIDSLGTFLDGYYLDSIETTPLRHVTEATLEDTANISYQLTFLIVAAVLFLYVYVIKKDRTAPILRRDRLLAAVIETGGQIAYVYALSGNGIVAAPVIASYCVASVVLARVFLKEKLPGRQYIAVGLVFAGILALGVMEGLGA